MKLPMKAALFSVIALIGTGFFLWDSLRLPPQINAPNFQKETQRTTIPDAAFMTINRRPHRLYDFKGKIIVLNFWATWCPPCVAEFPDLLVLAKNNPDDLVLVALSVDEEPEKIEPFFERFPDDVQKNITLPNVIIAHDPGKVISQDLFQTVTYPETYLIAPDMSIRQKIIGATDWAGDEIFQIIEQMKLVK